MSWNEFEEFDTGNMGREKSNNDFDDFGEENSGMTFGGLGDSGADAGEDYLHYGKQDFLSARFPEAFKNFNEAAAKGCARAYYFLGLMYSEGLGVTGDSSMAIQQWGLGSENNDLLCHMCLMDEDEYIDIYDDEESEEAQEALAQAEEDNFFAFQLAKLCDDYECVLLDAEQLKEFFERSAQEGNILAMYALYKFYFQDNKLSEAKDTLEEAAKRQYPRAMIKMGELYENGQDGFPQDLDQAMSWYSMAKDAKCSEANLHLGLIYYKREEYKSAFTYMKRAAKAGHVEAMVKLGLMYKNGWGTRVKVEEAMSLWRQAKSKGSAEAAAYLEADGSSAGVGAGKSDTTVATVVNADATHVAEPADEFSTENLDAVNSLAAAVSGIIANKLSQKDEQKEPETPYAKEIEAMKAEGLSQRDVAKEIVGRIVGAKNIEYWKFCPRIDSKYIVAANNNYAGRNLPFDVLAILDDATIPAFMGRSGIMLTSKKLITSNGVNTLLENIKNVVVQGRTIELVCADGSQYQYNSKKTFSEGATIEKLLLALAHVAKTYRS